jgi:hypothetical protein
MSGGGGKLREKGIWVTKIGHLGLGIIVVVGKVCLLNEGEERFDDSRTKNVFCAFQLFKTAFLQNKKLKMTKLGGTISYIHSTNTGIAYNNDHTLGLMLNIDELITVLRSQ